MPSWCGTPTLCHGCLLGVAHPPCVMDGCTCHTLFEARLLALHHMPSLGMKNACIVQWFRCMHHKSLCCLSSLPHAAWMLPVSAGPPALSSRSILPLRNRHLYYMAIAYSLCGIDTCTVWHTCSVHHRFTPASMDACTVSRLGIPLVDDQA